LRLHRIGFVQPRIIFRGHPRLRIQRQAVAHRRIAGQQVAALVAQEPGAALPAGVGGVARERQHLTGDVFEALAEHLDEPRTLDLVLELRVERIYVARELPFTPQVIENIF
jgi:hypothetical protein